MTTRTVVALVTTLMAAGAAVTPGCPADLADGPDRRLAVEAATPEPGADRATPGPSLTGPSPTGPWAGTHVVLAPDTPLFRDVERSQLEFHLGHDPAVMRLVQRRDGGLTLSTLLAPGLHCHEDLEGLGEIDVRLYAAEDAALEVNVTPAAGLDGNVAVEFAPGATVELTLLETATYELALPATPETGRSYSPAPSPGPDDGYGPLSLIGATTRLVPRGIGETVGLVQTVPGGGASSVRRFTLARLGDEQLQVVDGCVSATIPLTPEQRQAAAEPSSISSILGTTGARRTLAAGSTLYWSDGSTAGTVPEEVSLRLSLGPREGTDRLCGEPGDPWAGALAGLFAADPAAAPTADPTPKPVELDRTLELCVDRAAVIEPTP